MARRKTVSLVDTSYPEEVVAEKKPRAPMTRSPVRLLLSITDADNVPVEGLNVEIILATSKLDVWASKIVSAHKAYPNAYDLEVNLGNQTE